MDPMVLIVGECNPLSLDARYALYDMPVNSSGHRLRTKILGLRRRTYLGPLIHRTNLCVGRWHGATAQEVASRIMDVNEYELTLLLGKKVKKAFGATCDDFDVAEHRGSQIMCVPHPSGLCQEWNGGAAAELVRKRLSRVVPKIEWGELL